MYVQLRNKVNALRLNDYHVNSLGLCWACACVLVQGLCEPNLEIYTFVGKCNLFETYQFIIIFKIRYLPL